MRRFGLLVRPPWFTVCVGVAVFVARALASTGSTAARFPDSVEYETFSLFGHADRWWPVTAVYALVRSDGARLFVQVLVGSLAWLWLGSGLSRDSRWPRAVLIATAVLSLSPQIIRYDRAILSESLGISFAVLAVAATLHRLHRRTRTSSVVWYVCIALCAYTRPTHLLVLVVVCLPHAFRFASSRGRQVSVGGAAVLMLLALGVPQLQRSSNIPLLNLYTVVSSRVLPDDNRFEWFVDHGMPTTADMRTATGYDYTGQLPADIAAIVDLPEGQQPPSLMRVGGVTLAEWLRDNGWRTHTLYLATHPQDALAHARDLLDPALDPPNGDFLPLDNGPMLPYGMFGPWQLWVLCALAGTGVLWLRSRTQAALLTSIIVTVSLVYLATVHTSGLEHVRHCATVAAMLRVAGLCAVVLAFAPRQVRKRTDEGVSAPT